MPPLELQESTALCPLMAWRRCSRKIYPQFLASLAEAELFFTDIIVRKYIAI